MLNEKMYLMVGLGNPGTQYQKTRHNVGFMAIDKIYDKYEFSRWKKDKHSMTARGKIGDRQIILVKPTTFMNLSGDAVQALMTFYKIPIGNLIVFQDDVDLDVGRAKIKIGGSSAGHNGIKDIDAKVGKDYKRVRIGVGHPRKSENPLIEVADWVLSKFSPDDLLEIERVVQELVLDLEEVF